MLPEKLLAALWRLRNRSDAKQNEMGPYDEWQQRQYAAPSPPLVKRTVLIRNGIPDATWVETGTFLGDTTQLLSQNARFVYSLEPEPTLHANAVKRFKNATNVEIIQGVSEQVFPVLLPKIVGNVNFWLDGHYSAGITFKGEKDTPIVEELSTIASQISRLNRIVVMVDDIRCFGSGNPEYSQYPSLDFLVDWARTNGLRWNIEHDIFIARNS